MRLASCRNVSWAHQTVLLFQDWQHYTSKGCFFYEDNEIVTHVYQLKLTSPTTIYFAAYPVNEPACCKYIMYSLINLGTWVKY